MLDEDLFSKLKLQQRIRTALRIPHADNGSPHALNTHTCLQGAVMHHSVNSSANLHLRFGAVITLIVVALGYLAFTGVQDSKSYYVTIKELNGMGPSAYSKRLRVAGNVAPGSINRQGTHAEFLLVEQDRTLPVVYSGTEALSDAFKDDALALAEGKFGHDGVFHATNIQAKCASKYTPKQPGNAPASSGSQQKAELDGAQPIPPSR